MSGHLPINARRAFLQNAALRLGSALALPFLTRCAPTDTLRASVTASPTATSQPTQLPNPPLTPTLQKTPTTVPSPSTPPPALSQTARGQLVRAQSPSFWQGDSLSADMLRQALDASIAELAGMQDARKAWLSLFKATDQVGIKVNAVSFGATNPILVSVVTQCLMDVGIPAENITLYDRSSEELKNAGYTPNPSGSGIRCKGNDGVFTDQTWMVADTSVRLSQTVEACDVLINMPVLKGFSIGGISFALKNHYGSMENPSRFHDARFAPGVTGLNSLEPIKAKTRLIIGDILAKETHSDWTDYAVIGGVNTLLVGFDPLTVDTVGLAMALEGLAAKGMNTRAIENQVKGWLAVGEAQGLGVGAMDRIDIKEIRV